MLRRIYFLVLLCFSVNVCVAQFNPATGIKVIAKSKKEGVWIRWAPVNPTVWQFGNKYGYTVERFTVIAGGELENPAGEKLTVTPLKVYSTAALERLSNTVKEASVIQEIIYGEEGTTTYNSNNPASVLARNNELENMYGVALLVCDLSPEVAKAAALFFNDEKAVKGKRYIYRISVAHEPANGQPEQGGAVVDVTEEKPLPPLKDLKAEFRDKSVSLSWPTLLHTGIYSSYYIEKSTDGKTFARLSEFPYVHMSETPNTETAFFVDSLDANNKRYHYRIAGNSPFGETGPPSNIVSGEGKDDLTGYLIIRQGKAIEAKNVRIAWEFPHEAEKQISGFHVYRASKAEGPYVAANRTMLSTADREFFDETSFYNTYYQLSAIDKSGREVARSFPFLVQVEDNNPPAIPTTPMGTIEKNGLVKISWPANKDPDLMGYSIFRSNSLDEEFIEATSRLLKQPFFLDSIDLNVLNKKIHYRVTAVDNNYNQSDFSEVLTLTKPDVVPPTAPVFTKAEIEGNTIALKWVNSRSDDIAKVELIRIENEMRTSRVIRTWISPSPVGSEYVESSLEPGKTYQYKIMVYDSSGNTSAGASPQLHYETGYRNAVKDLTATVDRDGRQIRFNWKNAMPAIRCSIYRRKNDEPLKLYQTLEGNIESFTDKRISVNNRYSYKIQVTYPMGLKSVLSEEVKVIY